MGTVYVDFEPAEILAGPGLKAAVVDKIDSWTQLKVLVEKEYWVNVQTPDGKIGWVAKQWLGSGRKEKPEAPKVIKKTTKKVKKVAPKTKVQPPAVVSQDSTETKGNDLGSLDDMLAMVQKKQEEQRRKEKLEWKRKQEEEQRKAEEARLEAQQKKERIRKRVEPLKKSISKFEQIVASPYGEKMQTAAWKNLVANYPEEAAQLEERDTEGLLYLVSEGTEGQFCLKKGTKVCTVFNTLGLYNEPTLYSFQVRTIKKGTELTIIGNKDSWYEVRTDEGEVGYVAKDWVKEKQ